jgi:hypothetical protein
MTYLLMSPVMSAFGRIFSFAAHISALTQSGHTLVQTAELAAGMGGDDEHEDHLGSDGYP